MSTKIRLVPDFSTRLARAEIGIAAFAREAGVAEATIHQLMRPSTHPERRGGMRRTTAWKIANAFARLTSGDPDEAYKSLIVEEIQRP